MLPLVDEIKPIRPGTSIPISKSGKLESTLPQALLWLDNYYSLYHRYRPLAYMGLPRDAVEVEDFDYEDLWYRIKADTADADNRGLTTEDLKTMASALLKYKIYMK